jgi:ABC-type antimicrobial peptide transport system permease subunit
MSHSTGARTREIGVRMAFGAERGQVLSMVLRRGTWLAGVGVVVGLLGSLATTRLLASRLYGVAPLDPLTLGAAAAVLLATALVASWYPAWRAASVDPVRALRSE